MPTSMDFGSGPDIDGVSPPDTTPIEISADMTVGQLDNGLRYYIVENGAPGGQVELLLAVDAGSAQQPVPDSGNAHFLEHMMFNGTEDYPVNELDAVLRGLGVEIGPDLNAYTSFDETVYQMSMPTVDEDNLELGLRVLAQWAGAATINQSDVEAERGVVREEHRLRNESGGAEINERLFEYYTQNSGYENHLPIGSPEQILATDATELRAFYDDWYRPDNMAIIAVGDIDTATIFSPRHTAGITRWRSDSLPKYSIARTGPTQDSNTGKATAPETLASSSMTISASTLPSPRPP